MADVLELDSVRRAVRDGARQQADAIRRSTAHGRPRSGGQARSRTPGQVARTATRTDGSSALAIAPAPEAALVAPRPRPSPQVRPGPATERPSNLAVVPRRKRAFRLAALAFAIVFASMLALTIFEIRIAQNQLELDRTNRRVDQAQTRFDQLRKQNAQLRSPERLVAEAVKAGMAPGRNGDFLIVDPNVVAAVRAAQGAQPHDAPSGTAEDPFAAHDRVKAAIAGATR
jgi:cell division protein FtsL